MVLHRTISLFVFSIILWGCGGGSGSGSGTSTSNSVFSVSQSVVQFSAIIGESELPDAISVAGDVSNPSGNIFVEIELTDTGVIDTQGTVVTGTQLRIAPGDPASLGPGTHSTDIVVKACTDSACNNHISGSPKTIRVEYGVSLPPFEFVETSLPVFDGNLGTSGEPVRFDLETIREMRGDEVQFTNDIDDALFNFEALGAVSSFEGYVRNFQMSLVDTSGLEGGNYRGTLTASYDFDGHVLSTDIPIEVVVPAATMRLQKTGIAFSQAAGQSKLSDSVRIESTLADATFNWQASTNASWLTITSGGSLTTPLDIEVDPGELASESLYETTIEVRRVGSFLPPQIIHVAFWLSDSTETSPVVLDTGFNAVLADNIRPWLYVAELSDFEDNSPNDIQVYHLYTGELIRTISVIDSRIQDMRMSSDGQHLYVIHGFDVADNNGHISVINLQEDSVAISWTSTLPLFEFQAVLRPEDEDILVTRQGQVFRASDGHAFKAGEPVLSGSSTESRSINTRATQYCNLGNCGTVFYSRLGENIELQSTMVHVDDDPQSLSGVEVLINDDNDGYVAKRSTLGGFDEEGTFFYLNEFHVIDMEQQTIRETFRIDGSGADMGIALGWDGSVYGVGESRYAGATKLHVELFHYSHSTGMRQFDFETQGLGSFVSVIGNAFQVSADNVFSILPTNKNSIVIAPNPD